VERRLTDVDGDVAKGEELAGVGADVLCKEALEVNARVEALENGGFEGIVMGCSHWDQIYMYIMNLLHFHIKLLLSPMNLKSTTVRLAAQNLVWPLEIYSITSRLSIVNRKDCGTLDQIVFKYANHRIAKCWCHKTEAWSWPERVLAPPGELERGLSTLTTLQ